MKKQSEPWWKHTAQHMWRTYFAIKRDNVDWDSLLPAEKKKYAICDDVFRRQFVQSDQNILQAYFTSRWGDDLYTVEEYSLRNNVETKVIWMVIRRANRAVIEYLGLLDKEKKDNRKDDK